MTRFFWLLHFALTAVLTAQVQFDPPEDWIAQEVPADLPVDISSLRQLRSADDTAEVTYLLMPVWSTEEEARGFVDSQIAAMEKQRFVLTERGDEEYQGFTLKRLRGKFDYGDEGLYYANSMAIFTDQGTIALTVTADELDQAEALATDVLSWLTIEAGPVKLTESGSKSEESATDRQARRIGEIFGYVGFWVLLIGGSVFLGRKIAQRKARSKT